MTELEARKFADLETIRAPTLGGRLARWRTALGNAWHELRKSRTASIGAVMLVLLFGACIATPWITTALLAVTFGLSIGIPYGVLSGYFGGKVDTVAMRFVDGLLAFPGLLLYLLIVTLAREWKMEGIYNDMVLIFALGFAFTPEVARLSRSSVLVEKQKEYVEASRAIGEGSFAIALRQILPNIVSPLIVK